MSNVVIYTDGACSGNPGPGGWGAILIDSDQVLELGGGERSTTNNRMELLAIIEALIAVNDTSKKILVFSDSAYALKGASQWRWGWKRRGWKTAEGKDVSNQDLWQRLDKVLGSRVNEKNIQWRYVPGHEGYAGNERCDEIAVAFSKSLRPQLYEGSLDYYSKDVMKLPPIVPLPENRMHQKPKDSGPKSYLSYVDGILLRHSSWPECQARVQGRSGAKFKKVSNENEAQEVLKSWGLDPSRLKEI
ncbi:MAG: ribonuclease HI [Bdellovibrionales bacterium]|nr:ribonuclease HI [Bdellovibrionales bacterium]